MPTTVLLTGFGPFPGAPFNPTEFLVRRLARSRATSAGVRRIAHVFRTTYAAVDAELPKLIARHRPDVVLLFGLAARTRYLRIETRAINARSVVFPDADGAWPKKPSISPDGPSSLQGQAPHHRLLAAARATGLPARLSHDAGRYLCNFAYWRALERAGQTGGPHLVQFVHVPMVRHAPAPWRRLRRITLADLERAGEAILIQLVCAARASRYGRSLAAATSSAPILAAVPA